MAKKVKYGIVGAGVIADCHAQALKSASNSELLTVYDKMPERAHKFAEKYGIKACDTYEAFLANQEIDAVSIAAPSGLHMAIALPAAEAGKHILCEKPLDVTVKKAEAIISACRKNNVLLSVVFQLRLNPDVQKLKKAIGDNRLGRIVLTSMQLRWFRPQEYYDNARWRGTWETGGGGALMTQGIHDLDLMLYLNGDPAEVMARTAILTHTGITVEDNVCAVIQWANGALGVIEASTSCAPGFPRRLQVSGEKGSVTLEDGKITEWKEVNPPAVSPAEATSSTVDAGAAGNTDVFWSGHRQQFENLSNAIRSGEKLLLPGEEGLRSLRFVCGIYESARTGMTVRF